MENSAKAKRTSMKAIMEVMVSNSEKLDALALTVANLSAVVLDRLPEPSAAPVAVAPAPKAPKEAPKKPTASVVKSSYLENVAALAAEYSTLKSARYYIWQTAKKTGQIKLVFFQADYGATRGFRPEDALGYAEGGKVYLAD